MIAPVIGVLFVCTGNICRSPTAEGAFRAAVAAAGLSDRILAASAGTHGYHVGEPPDPRSIATARRFGIDLGAQRARQVGAGDFTGFRYVLAADRGHLAWLRRHAPAGATARIELMTAFAAEGRDEEVGDPYYGGQDGFDRVWRQVQAAAAGLLLHIQRHDLGDARDKG
jgi:protein-tyrosine phosphatase